MYDVFWWAAALSRMDTRDAMAGVSELAPGSVTRRVAPPEEVTTFNLVRRLASAHRRHGGTSVVALHSRSLEGGHAPSGRRGSGADLQMAVEVAPGQWMDLVLQAKKQDPARGDYPRWERGQIDDLRSWALRHGNRLPGLLLYNTDAAPFCAPGPGTAVHLGRCCSTPNQCHGHEWPSWRLPDRRSSTAVTLCLLPPLPAPLDPAISGDRPPIADINDRAMPWECLFCPTLRPGLTLSPTPPAWAAELRERAAQGDTQDADQDLGDADDSQDLRVWSDDWVPTYSLVLEHVPQQLSERAEI